MATASPHRTLMPAVAALLTVLVLALLQPLVGRADAGCDLFASPTGSDSASGSAAAPLQSPQRLADSLSAGQVGCFMAGTYDSSGHGIKVSNPGITLTSAPGGRATIIGRWWIAQGADYVTIARLNLDGRNSIGEAGPVVNAADSVFDDVDVTNEHTAICFILGSSEYGAAVNTVIENSRIHDCGVLPPENGDHGIYIEDSRDVVIRNNWIYDNADRGIQFYPHAVGTHVYGNVIYGNGEGVIFSGTSERVSTENVVEDNVISSSKVRWNAESYWEGLVGSGNVVRDNCVWGANEDGYYNQNGGVETADTGAKGFAATGNVIAEPQFTDPAAGDFTQESDSPCAFVQSGTEGATEVSTEGATEVSTEGGAEGGTEGATEVSTEGGAEGGTEGATEVSTEGGSESSAKGGKGEGKVTLKKHQKAVSADVPLLLTGHAEAPAESTVTVLRWKRRGWHRFARRRLRANGSFTVRKRLPGRHGTARLRAMVPGLGFSRVVKVRLGSARVRARVALARRASGAS
jgi:Periplasmic copper-binding protein (NosD)